jgi:hypothetical protein
VDAVDLARNAVTEDVAGAHIEAVAEGERVVTHYFECTMPAYRGWRWAVTVARVARAKQVTVCETVLLPGPDALVTPDWVPWEDRVAPGDLGIGDLMPTAPDDERLAPGYLLSEDPAVEEVGWELGLGRVRVLSRIGRLDTAERWYEGDSGPQAPIAQSAPARNRCGTCGFYLPLAGSMRAMFGACANVYAPDDGRVVSADHGCGAHSEVLVVQTVEVDEAPTIYDDGTLDRVEPDAAAPPAEPADEPADVATGEPAEVATDSAVEPAGEVATVAEPVDVAAAEQELAEVVPGGDRPVDVDAAGEAVDVAGADEVEPEPTGVPVDEVEEVGMPVDVEEVPAPVDGVDETATAEQTGVPVDDVEAPIGAGPVTDDPGSPDDPDRIGQQY